MLAPPARTARGTAVAGSRQIYGRSGPRLPCLIAKYMLHFEQCARARDDVA